MRSKLLLPTLAAFALAGTSPLAEIPSAKPEKKKDRRAAERLADAQAKRERRAAKRKALQEVKP